MGSVQPSPTLVVDDASARVLMSATDNQDEAVTGTALARTFVTEVSAPDVSPHVAGGADTTVDEVNAPASSPHAAVPVESADPILYVVTAPVSSPDAVVSVESADATVDEVTAAASCPYAAVSGAEAPTPDDDTAVPGAEAPTLDDDAAVTDAEAPPPDDVASSATTTSIVGDGDDCPLCLLPMGGAPAYIGDDGVPLPFSAVEAGVYRRPCGHVMHGVCAMRAIDGGGSGTACVVCRRAVIAAVPGFENRRVALFFSAESRLLTSLAQGAVGTAMEPSACMDFLRAAEVLPLDFLRMHELYGLRICVVGFHAEQHIDADPLWRPVMWQLWKFITILEQETWFADEAPLMSTFLRLQRDRIQYRIDFSDHFTKVRLPQGAPGALRLAMQCDEWLPRHADADGPTWFVPKGDQFKLVYPDGAWSTHPDFPVRLSPCRAYVNNVAIVVIR